MDLKEFNEDGVSLSRLEKGFIEEPLFEKVHENTVVVCHDILIRHKNGILLAKRADEPAKGSYFPIGGRLLRGVPIEESIRRKVKNECGLDIKNISYVSTSRTFFGKDPFSHGSGTDTLNLIYIGDGIGEISLDKTLSDPLVISKESYKAKREKLSSYNQHVLDIVNERNLW